MSQWNTGIPIRDRWPLVVQDGVPTPLTHPLPTCHEKTAVWLPTFSTHLTPLSFRLCVSRVATINPTPNRDVRLYNVFMLSSKGGSFDFLVVPDSLVIGCKTISQEFVVQRTLAIMRAHPTGLYEADSIALYRTMWCHRPTGILCETCSLLDVVVSYTPAAYRTLWCHIPAGILCETCSLLDVVVSYTCRSDLYESTCSL